jgi:hypothetical protein
MGPTKAQKATTAYHAMFGQYILERSFVSFYFLRAP